MSEPKFRPGDIVRKGDGAEVTVFGYTYDGRLRIAGHGHLYDEADFELVFRPATREETEALRARVVELEDEKADAIMEAKVRDEYD